MMLVSPPSDNPNHLDPAYADSDRVMRIGLWSLTLALGGFLLWAATAPLDEGVPTQGVVTVDTKRKAVQHLQGGIIREVRVGEGDFVTAGEVLVTLDDAATRANYESIRQHYYSVRAMEGRLLAEQSGRDRITFHPDLLASEDDPLVQQHLQIQRQLFASRQAALSATLEGIEAAIAGQQARIAGGEEMLAQRRRQLASLEQELDGIRDLVIEGYAPRNRQSDLERRIAEVTAGIAELHASREQAQRTIDELQQQARQRREEGRREVDGQLAEVRREVQADAEKLSAVRDELQRTELRAPVTGQVVGLTVQTVGGVIQPAQKLMDIVPADAPLLLETRIAPHLADRVAAGLAADVRFSAFAHAPQLVVAGEVVSMSGDLLVDEMSGQSYFLARVALTEAGMSALDGRQIQPGMPAEVIIRTGERSLLTYLLYPLVRRIAQSMTEE